MLCSAYYYYYYYYYYYCVSAVYGCKKTVKLTNEINQRIKTIAYSKTITRKSSGSYSELNLAFPQTKQIKDQARVAFQFFCTL